MDNTSIVTNFVTISGPNTDAVKKITETLLHEQKAIKRVCVFPPGSEIKTMDNTKSQYDYDEVFDLLKKDAAETAQGLCVALCQFTSDIIPDADIEAVKLTNGMGDDCAVTWRWHLRRKDAANGTFEGRIENAGFATMAKGHATKNEILRSQINGQPPNGTIGEYRDFISEYKIEACKTCPECGEDAPLLDFANHQCLACNMLLDAIFKTSGEAR